MYLAMKCTKWPKYIPNGQIIYQPFQFQGPPKFTQIVIFGLKIYIPSGNPALDRFPLRVYAFNFFPRQFVLIDKKSSEHNVDPCFGLSDFPKK
jgi:hypothetical protein